MKGKIMMMVLLCALLVGLVPVQPAAAADETDTESTYDDVKYSDIEGFMNSCGYQGFFAEDGYTYIAYIYDQYLLVQGFCFDGVMDFIYHETYDRVYYYFFNGLPSAVHYYQFYSPEFALLNNNFSCLLDYDAINKSKADFNISFSNSKWYYGLSGSVYGSYYNNFKSELATVVYSDLDIFVEDVFTADSSTPNYDNVIFYNTKEGSYSFKLWCKDAGLNCVASSNESPTKIPYSYNDYWHIVRKTSNGKWLLTTIGNSVMQENIADYRLLVGENGNLHVASIYSGDDVYGYKINVRQYEYDTDGWKVRTYETFDTRDSSGIVDLGFGSGFDDTRVLAYTSESIFDYNGSLPLYEKSTEYYEVTVTPPTEEPEVPSVTPTVAPLPTVVPPISAGQATVIKNRTAIYEEPSSASQVQHYLFEGGLVYVVEEHGEDWYYVRYDMGGLSYTGYVAQDNVNYDIENGLASEDVIGGYQGQVDDLLGMVGNVPKMIYALFSFLPPWCLALVGVSFTAMLALIGWKILRG